MRRKRAVRDSTRGSVGSATQASSSSGGAASAHAAGSSVGSASAQDAGSSGGAASAQDAGSSGGAASAQDAGSSGGAASAQDAGSSGGAASAQDAGSSGGAASAQDAGSSGGAASAQDAGSSGGAASAQDAGSSGGSSAAKRVAVNDDLSPEERQMAECFKATVRALPVPSIRLADMEVADLPFVNRIDELVKAAQALVENQRSSAAGSKHRMAYTLVMCAQMWGIGKTTFGDVLHKCLQAWYDKEEPGRRRVAYHFVDGIETLQDGKLTLKQAFVAMLQRACSDADVPVQRLPLDNYVAAVCAVSSALQKNADGADGSATTDLFIHIDEMDLQDPEVLREFPHLALRHGMSDKMSVYGGVWRSLLQPLLMAPRIHLIVTGREPELALCGLRGGRKPPTLGLHAVLGPLRLGHIEESLQLARMDDGRGVLDVVCGVGGSTRDEVVRRLCSELQRVTGGVPRAVGVFLSRVLRRCCAHGPLSLDFAFSDADVQDEVCKNETLSQLAGNVLMALRGTSGDAAHQRRVIADVTQLARYAFDAGTEATASEQVAALLSLADRYGCYVEAGRTPGGRRVCIPYVLHNLLFGVGDVLAESLPGALALLAPEGPTPEEIGQQLERQTMWALRLHLALSHAASAGMLAPSRGPTSALASLAGASRAFDGVDWSEPAVFAHGEDKFTSANAATIAQRWLHPDAEWLRGRTGVLLPPPKSRAGDVMCSLRLANGKRRLVFFLCRSYTSRLDDAQVADEFVKCRVIMDTVRTAYQSFVLVLVCTPKPYVGRYKSGRSTDIDWAPGRTTRGSAGHGAPAFYFVNAPQTAIAGFLLGKGSTMALAVAEAGERSSAAPPAGVMRRLFDWLSRAVRGP